MAIGLVMPTPPEEMEAEMATWVEGESFKTGDSRRKERLARYIEWCLMPKATRGTQKALAEELGVTEQTLRNYRSDPKFQTEVVERLRLTSRIDRLPDVLQSLYDQATDVTNSRSVAAAKLILDFVGTNKVEEKAEKGPKVDELSDEDLVKAAIAVLQSHAST